MIFKSREHAARQLADKLRSMKLKRPLILGIPRGAVPMAAVIADALDADLDTVLVHKFSPEWQPELALGAVTESGEIVLSHIATDIGVEDDEIKRAAEEQVQKLKERRHLYTPYRKSIDPKGREVVIVDDGIATGATMRAAILVLKHNKASRIVVAAPVVSREAARQIKDDGVETCFLDVPDQFFAVSQFYEQFAQVSDQEVTEILASQMSGEVTIVDREVTLKGLLEIPVGSSGIVLFAHGSGSGRFSPRNRLVADALNRSGIATLLLDLLEEAEAGDRKKVFDVELLTDRLLMATDWLKSQPRFADLPIGYFGASTGAAAALMAAARNANETAAVVSRGGRPDLAADSLQKVRAPTLLIVGGWDEAVLQMNQDAFKRMRCEKKIEVVEGATHLFEEPGTLERVAQLACDWFSDKFHALPQIKKAKETAKPLHV